MRKQFGQAATVFLVIGSTLVPETSASSVEVVNLD